MGRALKLRLVFGSFGCVWDCLTILSQMGCMAISSYGCVVVAMTILSWAVVFHGIGCSIAHLYCGSGWRHSDARWRSCLCFEIAIGCNYLKTIGLLLSNNLLRRIKRPSNFCPSKLSINEAKANASCTPTICMLFSLK